MTDPTAVVIVTVVIGTFKLNKFCRFPIIFSQIPAIAPYLHSQLLYQVDFMSYTHFLEITLKLSDSVLSNKLVVTTSCIIHSTLELNCAATLLMKEPIEFHPIYQKLSSFQQNFKFLKHSKLESNEIFKTKYNLHITQ